MFYSLSFSFILFFFFYFILFFHVYKEKKKKKFFTSFSRIGQSILCLSYTCLIVECLKDRDNYWNKEEMIWIKGMPRESSWVTSGGAGGRRRVKRFLFSQYWKFVESSFQSSMRIEEHYYNNFKNKKKNILLLSMFVLDFFFYLSMCIQYTCRDICMSFICCVK